MKGNVILIAVATFIISLLVTLNLFFHQNYQAEMAQQISKQQLLIAETIATDIRRNIEHLRHESIALANMLSDQLLEETDLSVIVHHAFATRIGGFNISVRIYGADNVLLFSDPEDTVIRFDSSLMADAGSLRKGDAAILESPSGHGISVVTPVQGHEGRRGTVVVDVPVDTITSMFLMPIKDTGPSNAWMMDQHGTLLYHPTMPEMVGKNLYRTDESCFECHKSFEVEKRILDTGGTAVQSYIAPFGEDKIIASASVPISGDRFWITAVSIPYSEVTASIRQSMRLHSIVIIAIFISTVVGAFGTVLINRKRLKAEARARHEAELEHYAQELESAVEKRTLELISEKEKLNAIVSALDVGLFLADNSKKIIWVNKTLRDWFGDEAVKGLTLDDIYGGTEVQASVADDRMVQELVYHKLGKREGYFQITSTPLAGPDGSMQLLGLIHDVTEIKRFEEQMAHSEKLASVGRLTAGIAHEIGNPLTSVSSFLQLLKERETDEFKQESIDTIMFHINRIVDTVRQLSLLSKLPPTEMKPVQINDVIESSLMLLQFDKRAKELTVDKDLAELPEVVTDANQISQVFVNIILNAVDAMGGDGGTLSISSKETPDSIRVEVSDTGPGVGDENLQRVFDPFFTTKEKGTGLGLSVSYGIMKRLGGDIAATNVSPHGARFTITVPKRKEQ